MTVSPGSVPSMHRGGRAACRMSPEYHPVLITTRHAEGMMRVEVETRNVDGQVTALGTAEHFTLVVDRPIEAGGGGHGFNGGQLLYLAIAGCISNDLFREARSAGITLSHVRVRVHGEFARRPGDLE